MSDYRITVSKDHLVFSAGHFITYGGGQCETLHGHNYRVGVTLHGKLDEHSLLFDFVRLKKELGEIIGRLDHRMLLPENNPLLGIDRAGDEIEVRHGDRRYVFPAGDVVFLPVPNTTAELLAGYLADRLADRLAAIDSHAAELIEVEVEESFGQSGFCTRQARV